MNGITKQQRAEILKDNKKIEDAVLISQMMDHPGWKIAKKYINAITKKIQIIDILMIKTDQVDSVRDRVIGINEVMKFFESRNKIAMKPRQDPLTGEVEVMNTKK